MWDLDLSFKGDIVFGMRKIFDETFIFSGIHLIFL